LAPLRKAVADAEKRMEILSAKKAKQEADLADPKLYNGPADAVTAAKKALAETVRDLDLTEQTWMSAQEQLEAATAAG
jgi:ATP-binding cassette subfamily F protein 3